ncbi:23S rRNA (pseudouridine(1915)-N(3))-methyltransferase RlmH [Campylobacter canadensis]|uniref:Ribosomal RNA large subunit methyltransferase H n=1 Tax=Campylobacter canadensis TaxID=449520 RepID=A0ABS7WUK3_9BACT|nr:23S rRNA (pseudouridine(1915)-N(3))-methyltransferase RlmH [Campylobacter canadensis]MBZ7988012.1 23S rRNA (pseudouridine(1915)-N(3))-methyltransferase RlmH [Campylobacter canadensis]MBZ7995443.1 23S rRNA (pseudouridine(1915)-N(3))-methyltransferase RlmH [Campylobacter canadensis]MBZ7997241.1 23S rRNA (pseudouridine(1915)-N(3))-methyltransferase RlmH [Campylobacter canadensis]MBZ7998972.1 23S rRNA (pseudouridine(1915)-N(3))-methyltransferase RlmH [Campylobacter canadensis]MBZ8000794.1 23S r
MKINIFYIQKDKNKSELEKKYEKLLLTLVAFSSNNCFNKKIANAQSQNEKIAQSEYENIYLQSSKKSFSIALSEEAKELNSFEFAKLLSDKQECSFFIGGAYGLSDSFKDKCDVCISLSKLTTTHELARIFLLEQIYRALCINSNHPYHK